MSTLSLEVDLHSDLLAATGLTAAEEQVYRTLVTVPAADLRTLAASCALSRGEVAEATTHLVTKGFITHTPSPEEGRYVAVPPDIALEPLIAERESQLHGIRQALVELTSHYQQARIQGATQLVEILTGSAAIHQQFHQMQRQATAEMLVLTQPPFFGPADSNDPELELLARGVSVRSIYDREALESHGSIASVRQFVDAGEQARVMEYLPSKLVVIDAQLALVPLVVDEEQQVQSHALLVRRCSLLKSLVALFETLWSLATPLPPDLATAPATALGPLTTTSVERQVLAMMFAGLTDKAIATQLGSSQRTVQRHIRALMDKYGVDGRFQLGAVARERGLLG